MFDANEHILNQSRFTAAQLAPYQGMQVAWSFDGKTIYAAAPTGRELSAKMKELGIVDYVKDYVDPFIELEPSDAELAARGLIRSEE